MQRSRVNMEDQKRSQVPRMLEDETMVTELRGRVQFGVNVVPDDGGAKRKMRYAMVRENVNIVEQCCDP